MKKEVVDFAIITIVEIELQETLRAFGLKSSDRVRIDSRVYWLGNLALGNGDSYKIVIAQSPDMANVEAALITADTIRHWNPEALLLIGIAGSADKDVYLGDIVIGRDIYYYERGKVTAKGNLPEPLIYRGDATLFSNIRSLPLSAIPRRKRPDGSLKRSNVHCGVIASGEKVIADKRFREKLRDDHRKVLAIEMEGYGFSAAVWQSFERKRHLVIRAICDHADRKKNDNWQPYAAKIASLYAKNFLLDRPLTPTSSSHQNIGETVPIAEVAKERKGKAKVSTRTISDQFDVFISYSQENRDIATQIKTRLENKSIKVWIDFEQIEPGDFIVKKIEEGLTKSSAMILLITPSSMESGWVEEEYTTAISRTKDITNPMRVIPVLVSNAQLPAFLSNRLWIDLRDDSNFEEQINVLIETILDHRTEIQEGIEGSQYAINNIKKIVFFVLFPEGLLKPVASKLIEIRDIQKAFNWAMRNGYLLEVNSSGGQLIAVAAEEAQKIRLYLAAEKDLSYEIISKLLRGCFPEVNPFINVYQLGFGRALLLRDMLVIGRNFDRHEAEDFEEICILARKFLSFVIDEEFYRFAFEISAELTKYCGYSSPRDLITKAQIMAHVGKSEQAVQLFDLYRDDDLFAESGLDEIERVIAAIAWAKAIKDSGLARRYNEELIIAYDDMLRLVDGVIEKVGEDHSLKGLKANILNNRATQIAVFGRVEDWENVQKDFELIISLFADMDDKQRTIGAFSNYVALTIDRFDTKAPFDKLIRMYDVYDKTARQLEACEDLFFYYYQKARMLKRISPGDLSAAIAMYEMAYQTAKGCEIKRRYPIAKRWKLKLLRAQNNISESDFLSGLEECVTELRNYIQDDWALNTLCEALNDIAHLNKLNKEFDKTWGLLTELFDYRIMQYTHSGSKSAKKSIFGTLEEMDTVNIDPGRKHEFINYNLDIINKILDLPRTTKPSWTQISHYLNERGK